MVSAASVHCNSVSFTPTYLNLPTGFRHEAEVALHCYKWKLNTKNSFSLLPQARRRLSVSHERGSSKLKLTPKCHDTNLYLTIVCPLRHALRVTCRGRCLTICQNDTFVHLTKYL